MINVVESEIINVKVQINILMCHNHTVAINGLSIFYNHKSVLVQSPDIAVEAFNYYIQKSCLQY